jgi:hypothetical protein
MREKAAALLHKNHALMAEFVKECGTKKSYYGTAIEQAAVLEGLLQFADVSAGCD